jgi:hypothetical protein
VKERFCADVDLPTCGLWSESALASVWYQSPENFFAFCSREEGEFTMPPRRMERKTPDPPEEREISRRRGRQMTDPTMEREMRDLRARLEDIETAQRRTVSAGDLSDFESEVEIEHEEEVVAEDAANECLIRAIARMGAREKMDILVYE